MQVVRKEVVGARAGCPLSGVSCSVWLTVSAGLSSVSDAVRTRLHESQ
jgi:hypothetical protein